MRRTAESRGFGRVSFTFSLSYLGTLLCGCVFGESWFCGFVFAVLVGFWYAGFLQINACPLHIQENQ